MQRIIVVSNRLPITIGETIKKSSGGLVSALEGADSKDLCWVGWPGECDYTPDREREITGILQKDYNYIPVFMTNRDHDEHYLGFSNSSLWPLLHYMPNFMKYDSAWWETYRAINERFATTVVETCESNDIVWVHDYHLMLVPSLIKQKRPDLRIGFFLHTPFPSYEVFRCHPNRAELLEGLLGSDLIGFHTFGYLRHFRSALLRILEVESEFNQIPHNNMVTRTGVFPIGINWEGFKHMLFSEQFEQKFAEIRESYRGKKLVLSIERLDYTKGIPRKLEAIDLFFEKYPEERENVVFVLVAVPSREGVGEYLQLKNHVEHSVGHINGKHSTVANVPVHFIHRGIPFDELCSLYSLADVALVTPLIDGMNLVAKEYLACKKDANGVLILSEFAGAAQELFNAVMVNPYDIGTMAQSVYDALRMTDEEKRIAIEPMRQRVIQRDARVWAGDFVRSLREDAGDTGSRSTDKIPASQLNRLRDVSLPKAFFLDYDGTLREFVANPRRGELTPELKTLLDHFQEREDIDVYIASGRYPEFLERNFMAYDFTLIAEHGFVYRRPGFDWETFEGQVDLSWIPSIREIFEHFSLSTPGSFVEVKRSSVVWHYRNSDPEFGNWKALELTGELMESVSNLPVQVHHGQKVVEVSSAQINKGQVMKMFLDSKPYQVVLCAGDSSMDETMFAIKDENLISIKVGSGETNAMYRLATPAMLRMFLSRAIAPA